MSRQKASQGLIVLVDVILINVAFVLSYIVRYQLELPYPVEAQYYATFVPYIPFAILLTALCLLMFRIGGLYDARRRQRFLNKTYSIVNGTFTSIVIIMAITFFLQPLVYSRGMLVLAGVLIVFLLVSIRLVRHIRMHVRRRKGVGVDRVLIVGAGEVGRAVIRTILAEPVLGYRVVGYIDDDPSKGDGLGRIKSLGGLEQLSSILAAEEIDEVIITLPWMYHRKIMQIVEVCERARMRVRVVPDVFQRRMQNIDLDSLRGIPLISPAPVQLSHSDLLIKRAIDLAISIVALPFFAVIFVIAGLLIVLDSRGPIIFPQERIGRDARPFRIYKFRTMVVGADDMKDQVAHLSRYQGDTLLKVPDDPRVTKIGRFLRRTSIDELPQILNVLRGEMSWVGPRPNTPDEVEQYEPWQRKRLGVLPGITGLWQVSGRSDVPFDEMVLLDIFYIENWSLDLDIRILLQTIPYVIFGFGAY